MLKPLLAQLFKHHMVKAFAILHVVSVRIVAFEASLRCVGADVDNVFHAFLETDYHAQICSIHPKDALAVAFVDALDDG